MKISPVSNFKIQTFNFKSKEAKQYVKTQEADSFQYSDSLNKKFLELYKKILSDETYSLEKELAYYSNLYSRTEAKEKSSPFTDIEIAEIFYQDTFRRNNGDMFVHFRNYVSKLSGTTKLAEIEDIIWALKNAQKTLPKDIYQQTLRIMDMCKTKDGYDFCNIEEKNKTAKLIEWAYRELIPEDKDEFYKEIIETSKDESGNIDFDLIQQTLNIMMSQNMRHLKPSFVMSKIKQYYNNKVTAQQRALLNSIIWELNEGIFEISDKHKGFEDMMNLCFDQNQSLNPIKLEAVSLFSKRWSEKIANRISKIEDNGTDEDTVKEIIILSTIMGSDFALMYFMESKDENGNFMPNKVNMNDFIEQKIKKADWLNWR